MAKAEKGTPKDIGKRIKAKGLQKLKFYCQMCEKQCRDANGFKCHLTSDSHLRQMKLFSENAAGAMDQFSKDFSRMFMETLRMRHGTSRVAANSVYQEVIQDKQHIHMNATMWASLTDFCQYLGKTGHCVVEQTERGWYVSYIERNVGKLAKQEAVARRQQAELAAEAAVSHRMEEQRVQAAIALDRVGGTVHTVATNLERTDPDAMIQLALKTGCSSSSTGGGTAADKKKKRAVQSVFGDDDDDDDNEGLPPQEPEPPLLPLIVAPASRPDQTKKRPRPAAEASSSTSKPEKKRADADKSASTVWLYRDIVVRIVNKKLRNGLYFKRKAVVDSLVDDYTARITVLDSGPEDRDGGDVLQLDQDDLATVIPKVEGKKVRVLVGRYRGKRALLQQLDKKKCQAVLELSDGTTLDRVDYEDFSKLA
jgi:DNA/RNA-binding protein KIN17